MCLRKIFSLVFAFLLVAIWPVSAFAADTTVPGCLSVSGTNIDLKRADSFFQIEVPYDGLYDDGKYITLVTVGGHIPSGASWRTVTRVQNDPSYSDWYTDLTGMVGITDYPNAVSNPRDPAYYGNVSLELRNPTGLDAYVYLYSVQDNFGNTYLESCNGDTTGGGTGGTGSDTTNCDICQCLSDIENSLGGITDALGAIKSEITPDGPPVIPSSSNFDGVLDEFKPPDEPAYTDDNVYFTDQGDDPVPGPLPQAPEPTDWAGVKRQQPISSQVPGKADPPDKKTPVGRRDPVDKKSPVTSQAPVGSKTPVGSASPVPNRQSVPSASSVPVKSGVPSADPVLSAGTVPAKGVVPDRDPVPDGSAPLVRDPVDDSLPRWSQ